MAEEVAPKTASKDVEENKVLAIIGYIGILFLVPMLAAPKSEFAQYHARQSLVLFIAEIIIGIIWVIPVLGWIIGMLGYIAGLVLMIMGIVNAANGVMKPLPIIGQYAKAFEPKK